MLLLLLVVVLLVLQLLGVLMTLPTSQTSPAPHDLAPVQHSTQPPCEQHQVS